MPAPWETPTATDTPPWENNSTPPWESPKVAIKVPAGIDPNAPGGFNYGGPSTKIAPDTALGEDFWSDLYTDASQPAVPLPKFQVQPDDSKPVAVAKSLANLVVGLPEFVESPLGVATAAAGGVIPRTVAAAFLGTTGKQVADQAKQAGADWDQMTGAQQAAALTDIGGQTLFAGLMAHGAGGKLADAVDTRINPAGMLARELGRTDPKFNGETPPTPIIADGPVAPPPGVTTDLLQGLQTAMRQNQLSPASGKIPNSKPTAPQAELATAASPSPMPEPAATLQAQVEATRDPQSPKAVTLVTPGETTPADHGLIPVETAQGTALVNPAKIDPAQAKAVLDAGGGGQLLGMSTDTKPDLATGEPLVTVQTKTADGTPVQEEVATDQTVPAAIAAGKQLAPDGTVEIKSPEQVIAERQQAVAEEPPRPMPVEVSPAQINAMRSGARAEAPPDILDTIGDHYPQGVQFASKADFGEYVTNARGAAKDLMSHAVGEPADKVIDALHLNGQFHNIETVDQLAQAMVDAGERRANGRGAGSEQARALAEMKKRDKLFQQANQPGADTEAMPIEQLFIGDQFKLRGQPMRVMGFATDEAGRPTGVELEGAYGRQTIPAGESIHLDQGSLNAPGRVAASGTSAPRPNSIGDNYRRFEASAEKRLPVIKSATDAPRSAAAAEQWWQNHGPRELTRPDLNLQASVSGKTIGKITAGNKPFPQARMAMVRHLAELFATAHDTIRRPDDSRDPQVRQIVEMHAPFEHDGTLYRARLLVKEFNPESGKPNKLHSGRIEDVVLESARPNLRLENSTGDVTASPGKTQEVPSAASPDTVTLRQLFNGRNPFGEGRVAASSTTAPRQTRKQPLQVPPAIAATPTPKAGPLAALSLGFKKVFAPHAIDAGAGQVANILRDVNGERAVKLAQAEEAMHSWRQEFDRTPVRKDWRFSAGQPLPHNYAIMDALERDRASLPPRYQQLAAYFDQAFKERIQVIQQFAPNALQHLIANYFPHIWEDPKRAAGVMAQIGNRTFAGRKEFLKQRTLPMFMDGLARGLKPISDNPVDLLLAKMASMDKFIANLKAQAEFKQIGKQKFKYALEPMPDGWVALDDPAFVVNAPPTVTVKEAFDMQLRTRTLEFLQKLGVPQRRLATLGGKRWGMAYESPEQIKTRFGGPMSVYWHELGHVLDYRYNLQKNFLKQGKLFDAELRNLADRRVPQSGAPKSFRQYVRRGDEKMAVMAEAYVHAPELFQRVAPTVYRAFDKFIEDHAELHDIRDIKPSLRMDSDGIEHQLPGVLKLGEWIMPEGPAQVLKNYLSPGFNGGVFRSVRQMSNLLNAAQLGLSAFHVGFTSLDASISTAEVGLYRLAHGDTRGFKPLAGAPLAPGRNYYSGKAIQRAMLDPNATSIKALNFGLGKYRLPGIELPISRQAHDIAALAVKGGLRATMDPFWQTHMTRNLMRSVREGGAAWAKTPLQAPLAVVEQMMRPISEYLVPRQKLGVFAQLARSEMDRLPAGADIHAVRAAMARAADATEDRMGQMTYDNLFYNRMAKDLALLGFRAYGWQLGKYRHLAGAVADTAAGARQITQGKLPDLTHRQLYFVTLAITVGAIGGILHRIFTGQNPQTLADYLHPSTGQKDALGNDKRLSLPSYLKDLESDQAAITQGWKQGGPLGVGQGLFEATYHRLNPWVSEAVDMLHNRDFYGTQIWNPDDPLSAKMLDQAKFIAQSGIPFSIAGTLKMQEGEHSLRDVVLPFIGVVPAKRAISMTPAQIKAAEIAQASQSIGGRTQEQAAHSAILRQAVTDLRTGKPAVNLEGMSKADEATIKARLQMNPLQFQVSRMPMDSAMAVFDLANPQERQQLAPFLVKKLQSQAKRGEAINTNYVRILTQTPAAKP